jgi:BMFP domain-containing protein YqiC
VNRQRQSDTPPARACSTSWGRPRLTELLAELSRFTRRVSTPRGSSIWGPRAPLHRGCRCRCGHQAALLDLARLSLVSDVARNYFELRTTQRQIQLMREDIAALESRLQLLEARAGRRHQPSESGATARRTGREQGAIAALLAQEGASANQIALLLGERPGAA